MIICNSVSLRCIAWHEIEEVSVLQDQAFCQIRVAQRSQQQGCSHAVDACQGSSNVSAYVAAFVAIRCFLAPGGG
jgi:hypothetical protein